MNKVFIFLLLYLYSCSGKNYKGDDYYIEIYTRQRPSFDSAIKINKRVLGDGFCYHFVLNYTPKYLLHQICDSIREIPDVPRSTKLLNMAQKKFYIDFMHRNRIELVTIYPDSSIFTFRNDRDLFMRPEILVLHDQQSIERGYRIDSLTYFLTPN